MNRIFLLAPFALLLGQGYLKPEEPSRIFAAGPKAAYYMEPPELASKAYARKILWTADGSNLIVERLVPPSGTPPTALGLARETSEFAGMADLGARLQIVAWNKRSGLSHVLLDLDPARAKLVRLVPMAGSDRLVLTLDETLSTPNQPVQQRQRAYLLLAVGNGASTRLAADGPTSIPGGPLPPIGAVGVVSATGGGASTPKPTPEIASVSLDVEVSPARPLGEIVRTRTDGAATVQYFGPNGLYGKPLAVPPDARPGFGADGAPGMAVRGRTAAGKPTYGFYAFDPQRGTLGNLVTESGYEPEDPKAPPLQTRAGRDARISLLVSEGKPEEAGLVTSDGALPVLSPQNDAVAYLSGGGAYVRGLVKVDRKAYEVAMAEAGKQRSMEYAKEAGHALSMYSQDADDAFPPGGFSIPNAVGPYARDAAALQAFVYTFAGGVPSGGKGATTIGYVPGPGGRAVVYADGTIKWVPDGL